MNAVSLTKSEKRVLGFAATSTAVEYEITNTLHIIDYLKLNIDNQKLVNTDGNAGRRIVVQKKMIDIIVDQST